MSDVQVIDVALFVWAAGLTILLLTQIRALSAIVAVLRDGGALGDSGGPEWVGPLIGAEAPTRLVSRLEATDLGDSHILAVFVSDSCGPCGSLLQDLARERPVTNPLVAIFNGDAGNMRDTAEAFASLVIEGREGAALHSELNINATPAVVGINAGIIASSALAQRGLDDIARLASAALPLGEAPTSAATTSAPPAT